GLADIYAMAFNLNKFGKDSQWYCVLRSKDGIGLACNENMADPSLSEFEMPPDGGVGQPSFYLGSLYRDFSATPADSCNADANDLCGAHLNATIVSHWAYLLGVGTATAAPNPCGLTIAPLDNDPATGLKMVFNLAHL